MNPSISNFILIYLFKYVIYTKMCKKCFLNRKNLFKETILPIELRKINDAIQEKNNYESLFTL